MPNQMFPKPSSCFQAALAIIGLLAGLPSDLHAAIPAPNDTCASALAITSLPYYSPVLDLLNTTTNGDPALPVDAVNCQANSNVTRSVWFQFTPAATGLYTLSLGPDTATDFGDGNNDTVLALYTSGSGCAGPFSFVCCSDDAAGWTYPLASGISTNLNAGTTYYIVAWVGQVSAAEASGAPILLQLRVTQPVAPANDDCATAEVIPGDGQFPKFSSLCDSTLATGMEELPTCAPDGRRSLWFKFTPAVTANYVITTAPDSGTTVGDTAVALYSSSSGDCSTLSQDACDDNSFGRGVIPTSGLRSFTANVTYYIAVWDNATDYIPGETSVQLKIVKVAPPIVNTLAATSITMTTAVLNAAINANGGSSFRTRFWFEWGTSPSYTGSTAPKLLNSTARPVTADTGASAIISNLTAGVTYHYRAVATNELGTTYGADQSFTWSNARPTLAGPSSSGDGFRFTFSGQAGQAYMVQGSANLTDWADLGAAREIGSGLFEYTQQSANPAPWQFFRVRLP